MFIRNTPISHTLNDESILTVSTQEESFVEMTIKSNSNVLLYSIIIYLLEEGDEAAIVFKQKDRTSKLTMNTYDRCNGVGVLLSILRDNRPPETTSTSSPQNNNLLKTEEEIAQHIANITHCTIKCLPWNKEIERYQYNIIFHKRSVNDTSQNQYVDAQLMTEQMIPPPPPYGATCTPVPYTPAPYTPALYTQYNSGATSASPVDRQSITPRKN
ncbi:MAG: hypothetical protein OEY79_02450 [Anaplasmataceae bacterium]|nr:hypothetical protein [Anaplasmataceae bacterium]